MKDFSTIILGRDKWPENKFEMRIIHQLCVQLNIFFNLNDHLQYMEKVIYITCSMSQDLSMNNTWFLIKLKEVSIYVKV